ncbi:hypothetical protein GCM10025869_11540 [Homoserinibacter gongjuensis]|uniref:Uncharacterized protein n=1 Tax=Homoserinibacter gongjuensis TaxID=1162968 RepID=A0ABQ6JV48_9MICO|nr:hypothetical protein GCM10025869_11540 [Homoserinibacter gongjuensis]
MLVWREPHARQLRDGPFGLGRHPVLDRVTERAPGGEEHVLVGARREGVGQRLLRGIEEGRARHDVDLDRGLATDGRDGHLVGGEELRVVREAVHTGGERREHGGRTIRDLERQAPDGESLVARGRHAERRDRGARETPLGEQREAGADPLDVQRRAAARAARGERDRHPVHPVVFGVAHELPTERVERERVEHPLVEPLGIYSGQGEHLVDAPVGERGQVVAGERGCREHRGIRDRDARDDRAREHHHRPYPADHDPHGAHSAVCV